MARKPKVRLDPRQVHNMTRQLKRHATALERQAQSADYVVALIAVSTLGMATRLLRDVVEPTRAG